jgi:phosphoserine aminotransferase
MSSNIATRQIDWDSLDYVYAGLQKNLGPSGCCVSFLRKDLTQGLWQRADTPAMCDWRLFRDAPDKSHNTPTSWSIYVAGLNAKHMLTKGGIPYYQSLAEERSKLIYDIIDRSAGFYTNEVDPRFRSRVNLPFRVLKN